MKKVEALSKMADIEKEINLLPEGSVTKKNINGKDYFYHRINKDGKRIEKYVSFVEADDLSKQIKKRKELENKLKTLKNSVSFDDEIKYKTIVRVGDELRAQVSFVKSFKKRECFKVLEDYIYDNNTEKVFILYGLRRTGKTTLIRQMINEITEFDRVAFIQIKSSDRLSDINYDLRLLEKEGYKYIFIDEVTLMEDFVDNASLFSDIYASSGMKIVLSGTDSLGFAITKQEQLYDRCIMLHTTFIPYREFEEVLGIKGIDEYIEYGGTMSLGGVKYNESIFSSEKSAKEYVDTAIAKNIQHSLKHYQDGGHFLNLYELYEKGELTNIINRVVENINHKFTKSVIEETFKSHDLSLTAANLLRDRNKSIDIKEHINIESITRGIKDMLDILDKQEQSIEVDDLVLNQIKEYLICLDLIMEIDLNFLPESNKQNKIVVVSQPGLRFSQAETVVENLLLDSKFNELPLEDRNYILDRLLGEIKGRMMEEIVLLETKLAKKDKEVFKLQFPIGEFDMVVYDKKKLSCEIYEIKHSESQTKQQYRHLVDKDKCELTKQRYGNISGRYVIYRGEDAVIDGIQYLNVEKYLKSL